MELKVARNSIDKFPQVTIGCCKKRKNLASFHLINVELVEWLGKLTPLFNTAFQVQLVKELPYSWFVREKYIGGKKLPFLFATLFNRKGSMV